ARLIVVTAFDRDSGRPRSAVQFGEQVGRRLVAGFDRCGRIALNKKLLAEVLDYEQSGCAVGRKDSRRGKTAAAQGVGHRDEGRDVFRKMRDGAVRLAVAHGRAIRPFGRGHENVSCSLAGQPLIAARGGITLNTSARRSAVTRSIEESTHCGYAFDTDGATDDARHAGHGRGGGSV